MGDEILKPGAIYEVNQYFSLDLKEQNEPADRFLSLEIGDKIIIISCKEVKVASKSYIVDYNLKCDIVLLLKNQCYYVREFPEYLGACLSDGFLTQFYP